MWSVLHAKQWQETSNVARNWCRQWTTTGIIWRFWQPTPTSPPPPVSCGTIHGPVLQKLFTLTGVSMIYTKWNVPASQYTLITLWLHWKLHFSTLKQVFYLLKCHCCCVLVICFVSCSEIFLTVGLLMGVCFVYWSLFNSPVGWNSDLTLDDVSPKSSYVYVNASTFHLKS